jgi:hypothetical protein
MKNVIFLTSILVLDISIKLKRCGVYVTTIFGHTLKKVLFSLQLQEVLKQKKFNFENKVFPLLSSEPRKA